MQVLHYTLASTWTVILFLSDSTEQLFLYLFSKQLLKALCGPVTVLGLQMPFLTNEGTCGAERGMSYR